MSSLKTTVRSDKGKTLSSGCCHLRNKKKKIGYSTLHLPEKSDNTTQSLLENIQGEYVRTSTLKGG